MRMRLKDKKYAFSLTELLIVLVVLAVLFAALAPILTTRHNGASVSTENIWNYVNDDEQQKDIYYDSGVDKWSSTAYIGLKPSTLSTYSPRSKVVISASKNLRFNNTPQRQIQFRYGAGDGVNAGSLYMDSKNISLGSNNDALIGFVGLTVPDASKNSTENTVAGLGAMSTSTTSNPLPVISGNVAYGTNALKYLTNNRSRNTVVGASALSGSNPVAARDNIFVGSSVANYDRAGGTGNIAVGATSMFSGSSNTLLSILQLSQIFPMISSVSSAFPHSYLRIVNSEHPSFSPNCLNVMPEYFLISFNISPFVFIIFTNLFFFC